MAPRLSLPEKSDRVVGALGVVAPPPIHVQAPTFEGSLATLFVCVRDHKVDLLEVPLFPICEAYFEYLLSSANGDLDEAAAALSALAYLLERKAWMLLPVPEPEPEIEEAMELPEPTVAEFAAAIDVLRVWQEERDGWFFRSPEAGPNPYELPYTLANVSSVDLARAFERLLRKAEPDPERPIGKARRSITEQMKIVLLKVCHEWRTLEQLVDYGVTRTDAVYWFLALLELVRLGQVAVQLADEDVRFARA